MGSLTSPPPLTSGEAISLPHGFPLALCTSGARPIAFGKFDGTPRFQLQAAAQWCQEVQTLAIRLWLARDVVLCIDTSNRVSGVVSQQPKACR